MSIKEVSRSERLESNVLTAALLVGAVVSIVDSIWHFLDNSSWAISLIFFALIVMIRTLDSTRERVVAVSAGTPLRTYDTLSVYYSALMHAVQQAEHSVYAVFSHDRAPKRQTEESREYYEVCIRWSKKHPGGRAFHRIIRLPSTSPDIEQWVGEQKNLASEVENYHVRVLRYPEGMEPEGENFAVIDSSVVFLGFAMSDREEMKGFSIRDTRVAAAFEQHYRELWRLASGSDIHAQKSQVAPDQILDVSNP